MKKFLLLPDVRKLLAAGSACAVLGAMAPSATAQTTYTWTGAADTIFSNAANWNPGGGPPGNADNVTFGTSAVEIAVTGSSAVTNLSMGVNTGRVLRAGGSGGGNRYFTVTGTLAKSDVGALTIRSNGGAANQRLHLNVNHMDISNGLLALGVGANSYSLASLTINSATLSGGTMQIVVGSAAGTATIANDLGFTGGGSVYIRGQSSVSTSGILEVGSLSSAGGLGTIAVNAQTGGASSTALLRLNNPSGISSFSGVIQDGGTVGNVLSVEKNNGGTQVLSGVNTYTGATTINAGSLLVGDGGVGSLGNTAVTVAAGTLGGTGSIAGTVAVGNGVGAADSFLSAGDGPGAIGTLTLANTLSLDSDSRFVFEYNGTAATADQVEANGVTIDALSSFSFADLSPGVLAGGTTFLVINNTSGSAISGVFSNLADGSTFFSGANEFSVSYSGGTGNDLIFTVVPEPAASALLGMGLVSVLFFRRRAGQSRC